MSGTTRNQSTLVLFLVLLSCVPTTFCQFGIGRKIESSQVESDGHIEKPPLKGLEEELVAASRGKLQEQDAIDIVAVINSAKADAETMVMINKMKHGDGQEALLGFAKTYDESQIVEGLLQALEEMKMLEILFRDKERALVEMEKDGLIDKKRLPEYRKNPNLLEEDTRRSLFFTFCSLAVAGGYL